MSTKLRLNETAHWQDVFKKIEIYEPTVDETYEILKGLEKYYEEHHGVKYSDKAMRTAAELAGKYINDRFLPDKAIDVIDEVGASIKLLPEDKRPKKISVQMVENTVARMAKIPPKTVVADEKDQLKTLDKDLKKVLFGTRRCNRKGRQRKFRYHVQVWGTTKNQLGLFCFPVQPE